VEIIEQVQIQYQENAEWRRVAAGLLGTFVSSTEQNYEEEVRVIRVSKYFAEF
jgi:hypothetical protein